MKLVVLFSLAIQMVAGFSLIHSLENQPSLAGLWLAVFALGFVVSIVCGNIHKRHMVRQ